MEKLKLGIIFGGISTEHDVSIVSGTSIINNLEKEKYKIYPIYIDKNGKWYEYQHNNKIYKVGEKVIGIKKIENICEYLKKLDTIFPVLHGIGGEDGGIQGMLELLKIPYVGSKILGSCLCMDKVYAKIIFEKAQIPQAKYVYIKKIKDEYKYIETDFSENKYNINNLTERIITEIKFPMFVKPSNSGSSIGISKVNNMEELCTAIKYASEFDKKILIEENIVGREIECAVLGNENVEASVLGEIIAADNFYSFDAKYNNQESKTLIPAQISKIVSNKVRELAKKAYIATECKGLARIDFFVDEKHEQIYINEINTIPGFTEISMYPKLWEETGIKYSELLEKLIKLANEKE